MNTICTICGKEPRVGKCSFCVECRRTYQREWSRKNRGVTKPRPRPWRALEENEKYCGGCDRILDRSKFYKDAQKKDGRMSHCSRCDSFKQMRKKEKNKEKAREQSRISSARFRAAHPDYNAETIRLYRKRKFVERFEQLIYGKRD